MILSKLKYATGLRGVIYSKKNSQFHILDTLPVGEWKDPVT